MDLMLAAIAQDWLVLTPIFICSVLVVYVAINRISYYRKNERNISEFIPSLQKLLLRIISELRREYLFNLAV